MSVRRLDPVQPEDFAFSPQNLAWAKKTVSQYPVGKQASAVIALLWRAQEQAGGWLPRAAMEHVAQMLEMSYIRVLEVATFYTMFQLSPVGRKAHVQVCGTTPCMLRGAEDLRKVCQNRIHPEPHHLSSDGDFSWEEVECLGACVNAPMVQIWKDTYEDLTPALLEQLLDRIVADQPIKPGPQIDRQFSAPQGGATSLNDAALYSKDRKFDRMEAPPPPAPVAPATPVAAPIAAVAAAPVIKPEVAAKPAAVEIAKAVEVPKKLEVKPAVQTQPDKSKPRATTMPAGKNSGPELLKKPKGGKADDLKLIWGVGPALEKMLNKMGIWHFAQIAGWSAADLKWIDERLEGFKGRAKRDEWIKQSKKLATGWRPDSAVGEKPKGRG
jgi:NADH-quinone oxidoreductase subunit E